MKVRNVQTVTPSPDGRLVAWVESGAVMDTDKSETVSQVFLARADGGNRLQLTRGEKGSNAPAFSKDSAWVFFASDRSGKRNLYRIAVDGGEAEMLTNWTGTIAAYKVSPDGKWIAFAGREAEADEERARREKRDFRVIDENPRNQSLWLVPVETDMSGRRPVKKGASGPYNIGAFEWSPDSRRIAYETRPTPDADDARHADILEIEVETGRAQPIAATPATETQPVYSPDGRYLAYTRADATRLNGARIVLYTRTDARARELPPSPDQTPSIAGWSKDSSRIFFTEGRGTRSALYAMPVDGPASLAFQPVRGTFGFGVAINRAGTHSGLALQSPDEPVEAYVMELVSLKPVRVSAANAGLPKAPLGETRVIQWKAKDGKDIEGLLTLPASYDKSKRYPLIVNIHGGPAGAFNENFIGSSGAYPIASFAARGWAVLRPNPRGSTAYGLPFRRANINDWGGGDFNDIMSGVDHVISMGVADANRMAVMGWSYGGYMTNWVITQTSRFKCAASGAGLSNLISMWGTNDIPSTLDDYFEGAFYEQPERYIRMSPLFHVKNVTTPTLFLHGDVDIRVPPTQAYEMHSAIQRRGIETEMVVYPRTPHGPQEPKFVLNIMQRHIDWVAKHIGD